MSPSSSSRRVPARKWYPLFFIFLTSSLPCPMNPHRQLSNRNATRRRWWEYYLFMNIGVNLKVPFDFGTGGFVGVGRQKGGSGGDAGRPSHLVTLSAKCDPPHDEPRLDEALAAGSKKQFRTVGRISAIVIQTVLELEGFSRCGLFESTWRCNLGRIRLRYLRGEVQEILDQIFGHTGVTGARRSKTRPSWIRRGSSR